ncbi:uncharacterized protein LOC101863289 [Aplysia californica]|uniref:Uncharacterized protein LOC101863289 n=1 Tax=Aplysia californica TaxID=6500 RepID=A0ABM0K0D5_APLCA|nr:uncharacterized protein LOC101863289 [Aplysia californica]
MTKDLDNTHTIYLDTMTLSARPAVVWDPEPGALYTLISYDVGYLRLKGILVNIAGGDSSLGHELFPYHGPAHPIYSKTFQVFALFKQSGVIPEVRYQDIEDNVRSYMEQNKSIYLLSNLISVLNQIKDPMAIGLVATKTDPSAIGMAAQLNSINNCPYLLSRIPVLKKVMDVFNLTSRYNVFHDHRGDFFQDLEVDLEVQYRSDAVNFTSCCSEQMEPERLFQLDPISETPVKPVHLRNEPFLRFDAVNRMDKNFFFDKLFTVLLLDVTDASVNASSGTTPVLWMVTDIGGPYPSEGRTMVNYSMPMPAVSERRLYMFFVFRQPDPFPSNFSTSEYCMADGMARCDFNIFKFVSMNNLHFSGISWVRSEEDYFSRMKLYENDASAMDSACAGLPHYGTPCPDPCAATPTPRPPTPRPRGSASVFFSMVTVVQVLALSLLVLVVVRE